MRVAALALVFIALAAVPGCVSAKGAYEDGMALEQSGDAAGAARAYIRSLSRDASLPNVRGRLEVAGSEAVARDLAAAERVGPAQAAEHYLAADDLIRAAQGVGVELARPASFASDLSAALDQAVEGALVAARRALDAGTYDRAIQFLDTGRRYRPSPEQAAAFDATARDAYVGWAESDLAAGRYRAALGHTDAALTLGAIGLATSITAEGLDALRAEILDAGAVRVAVFPAESDDERLPRGFLRDLSDVLLDDAFARPQPFLKTAYPGDVRRLLREGRGTDGRFENPRLLSSLSRDLDADLGVAVEVVSLDLATEERQRRTVAARWRGDGERGGPPSWDRVDLRLTAEAVVAYTVVDASSRRVVCTREVTERVRGDYRVAESDHDASDLRLDGDDRRLFDDDHEADEQDRILLDLHHELAETLASRVAACALQQVP